MAGAKTTDNSQFAAVSADGTRAGAGLAAVVDGNGVEPLSDEEGRLWARVVSSVGPAGFGTPGQGSSAALTNSEQISAGARLLRLVSGANTGLVQVFAQIYDLAGAPGAATVPVQSIPLPAVGEFSWAPYDWAFANGIWFALSTTPIGFTSPGAGVGFWNAQWWEP